MPGVINVVSITLFLIRFVADVKADNDGRDLWNENQFIVKIPYVAGGFLNDKRSIKYAKGAEGILKSISQFVRNCPSLLGYIPFFIVQPRFKYTKEAKVSKSTSNIINYFPF